MASRTRRAAAATFVLPGPPDDAVDTFDAAARRLFADELALAVALLAHYAALPAADGPAYAALTWLVSDIETGAGRQAWASTFRGLLGQVAAAGGTDVGTMVGSGFSALDRGVYRAMTDRADTLARYVGTTTAGNIVESFRTVKAANGTAADLAHAISRDVLGEDAVSARAEFIANHEVSTAYNSGAHFAAVDSGTIQSKIWRHDGSPNDPRPDHEDMDGETVALDEPFSNGLDYACDPDGDLEETANCTCSVEYSEDPPDGAAGAEEEP